MKVFVNCRLFSSVLSFSALFTLTVTHIHICPAPQEHFRSQGSQEHLAGLTSDARFPNLYTTTAQNVAKVKEPSRHVLRQKRYSACNNMGFPQNVQLPS